MELQVTLTLSDRLFALLEGKLPDLGRRIEKAVTKEIGAHTRKESSIEISVNDKASSPQPAAPGAETTEKPQPEAAAPESNPEPEPAPADDGAGADVTTPDGLKKFMADLKDTLLGAGWNEDRTPEKDAQAKQINGYLREIARELGADRPTALPRPKIIEFCNKCNEITIRDGKVCRMPF